MRRTSRSRFAVLALGAVAVSFAATGCASSSSEAAYDRIKSNLTPEIDYLAQTPNQIDNQLIRTADTNGRLFWEDLAVFGLADRPSRLSQTNIVE